MCVTCCAIIIISSFLQSHQHHTPLSPLTPPPQLCVRTMMVLVTFRGPQMPPLPSPPLPLLPLPPPLASPLRPTSSPHPMPPRQLSLKAVMTFVTLFRALPMFSLPPTFLHKPAKSNLPPLLRGQVYPPLPPLLVSPSLPLCPSPLSPNTLLSTPAPKQHFKVTLFFFNTSLFA